MLVSDDRELSIQGGLRQRMVKIKLLYPCCNAYLPSASLQLLATFLLMQLSRQFALFVVTVHCWHISPWHLPQHRSPSVEGCCSANCFPDRTNAWGYSALWVLLLPEHCQVSAGPVLKFLHFTQKFCDLKHETFPLIQYHLQI